MIDIIKFIGILVLTFFGLLLFVILSTFVAAIISAIGFIVVTLVIGVGIYDYITEKKR